MPGRLQGTLTWSKSSLEDDRNIQGLGFKLKFPVWNVTLVLPPHQFTHSRLKMAAGFLPLLNIVILLLNQCFAKHGGTGEKLYRKILADKKLENH